MGTGEGSRLFAQNAAYLCGAVDRFFVARWHGEIGRDAMREVFDMLVEARRRAGVPLIVITELPMQQAGTLLLKTPADPTGFAIVDRLIDAIYVVIPGDDIDARTLRNAAEVGAFQMRGEITACEAMGDAIQRAARRAGVDAAVLSGSLRDHGLV